jgi:hypothetical protein
MLNTHEQVFHFTGADLLVELYCIAALLRASLPRRDRRYEDSQQLAAQSR